LSAAEFSSVGTEVSIQERKLAVDEGIVPSGVIYVDPGTGPEAPEILSGSGGNDIEKPVNRAEGWTSVEDSSSESCTGFESGCRARIED
jgi:hypothetical protein